VVRPLFQSELAGTEGEAADVSSRKDGWCLSLNFGDLGEQPAIKHNCGMDPSLYPAAWMLTLVILTALSIIVTSE
jgi:hypothetical protein